MRVVTNGLAIAALAFSPELKAVSLRKAEAGAVVAKRLARVDTGEMRDSTNAAPFGRGARVTAAAAHSGFNEYGTSLMSAKPFVRPSMPAAAAG